jgi:hypothetical protein
MDEKLRVIVAEMIQAGESDEDIALVIKTYKAKHPQQAIEQVEAPVGYVERPPVTSGFGESLWRGVKGTATGQIPAMGIDFANAMERAGTKFADLIYGDDPARQARSLVESLQAGETAELSKKFKEKMDYTGMATQLSDVYDLDTGEFKPENIGSFIGYSIGQILPQLGVGVLTGGSSFMAMGIGEAQSSHLEALEAKGYTPTDVFLKNKDKNAEALVEGVAIGLLDRAGFEKIMGKGRVIKNLKDVLYHGFTGATAEFVTEQAQEVVGGIGGEVGTRDWDAVKELLGSSEFWYDRVLTAGVSAMFGAGASSTAISGTKLAFSKEEKQEVKEVLEDAGIDVDKITKTDEEQKEASEDVKTKAEINKTAKEAPKTENKELDETLDLVDAEATAAAEAIKNTVFEEENIGIAAGLTDLGAAIEKQTERDQVKTEKALDKLAAQELKQSERAEKQDILAQERAEKQRVKDEEKYMRQLDNEQKEAQRAELQELKAETKLAKEAEKEERGFMAWVKSLTKTKEAEKKKKDVEYKEKVEEEAAERDVTLEPRKDMPHGEEHEDNIVNEKVEKKEEKKEAEVATYEGGARVNAQSLYDEERVFEELTDHLRNKYADDKFGGHKHHEAAKKWKEDKEEFARLKKETGWQKYATEEGISAKINLDTGQIVVLGKDGIKKRKAKKDEIEAAKPKPKVTDEEKVELDRKERRVRGLNRIKNAKKDKGKRKLDKLKAAQEKYSDIEEVVKTAQTEIDKIEEQQREKEEKRVEDERRKKERAEKREKEKASMVTAHLGMSEEAEPVQITPAKLAKIQEEREKKDHKQRKNKLNNEITSGNKTIEQAVKGYQAWRVFREMKELSEEGIQKVIKPALDVLAKRETVEKSKMMGRIRKQVEKKEKQERAEKEKVTKKSTKKTTKKTTEKPVETKETTETQKEIIIKKLQLGKELTSEEQAIWDKELQKQGKISEEEAAQKEAHRKRANRAKAEKKAKEYFAKQDELKEKETKKETKPTTTKKAKTPTKTEKKHAMYDTADSIVRKIEQGVSLTYAEKEFLSDTQAKVRAKEKLNGAEERIKNVKVAEKKDIAPKKTTAKAGTWVDRTSENFGVFLHEFVDKATGVTYQVTKMGSTFALWEKGDKKAMRARIPSIASAHNMLKEHLQEKAKPTKETKPVKETKPKATKKEKGTAKEEEAEAKKKVKESKKELEEKEKKDDAEAAKYAKEFENSGDVTLDTSISIDDLLDEDEDSYTASYRVDPHKFAKDKNVVKEGQGLYLEGRVQEKGAEDHLADIVASSENNILSYLFPSIKKLITKVNQLKARAGLAPTRVFVADKITDANGNEIAGAYLTHNKTGESIIVVTRRENASGQILTAAHEYVHPYLNLLMGSSLEDFAAGRKFQKEVQELFKNTLKYLNQRIKESQNDATKERVPAGLLEALKLYEEQYGLEYDGKTNGIYGLSNYEEFVTEAFTNPFFLNILNNIPVNTNQPRSATNNVLFKLANDIIELLSRVMNISKIKHDSVLGRLNEYVEAMTEQMERPEAKVEELLESPKLKALHTEKKRRAQLWEIIKEAQTVTSIKSLRELVGRINEKLPAKFKVTKQELEILEERFSQEKLDKREKTLLKSLKTISDLSQYTAKGIFKKSKISDEARKMLADIHDRLTKKHTDESVADATVKLNQLIAIQNNILTSEENTGLTEEQQREFDLLRYELAHVSSRAELVALVEDLKSVIKEGKTSRALAMAKRKTIREEARQKTKQYLTGKEEGTITKKEISDKEEKDSKRFLGKFRSLIRKDQAMVTSWQGLMNLLAKFDPTSTSEDSFFHRMFAATERKANMKKEKGIQEADNRIMDKMYEIFLGDKLTTKDWDDIKKSREGLRDTPWKIAGLLDDFTKMFSRKRHSITYYVEEGAENEGTEQTERFSDDQLIPIWLWSKDPVLVNNLKKHGYGADFINQVNEIMESRPDLKALAEWITTEFMPDYYDKINKVYKEQNFMDLDMIPGYLPVYYDYTNLSQKEAEGVSLVAEHSIASVNKRNTMSRVPNNQKLDLQIGIAQILHRHVRNSEHYINYNQLITDLKSVFFDREVQNIISTYYSKEVNRAIRFFIDNFASKNNLDTVGNHVLDWFRKVIYPMLLGINPTIYLKQASSSVAYSAHMPKGYNWYKMQTGTYKPKHKGKGKKWAIEQMSNSPLIKKRARRSSRTLSEQDAGPARFFGERVGNLNVADMSMWLVKKGDLAAIIHGGWPMYLATYEHARAQGMSDKAAQEYAEFKFVDTTLQTQQSTETADLSEFQLQRGVLARYAGSFITTPMQYARRFNQARRAFMRARKRGDIETRNRAALQMAMYGLILPMLFAAVSQGFKAAFTDDDEKRAKLLMRILYSPINSYLSGSGIMWLVIESGIKDIFVSGLSQGYRPLYSSVFEEYWNALGAMKDFAIEGEQPTDKEIANGLNVVGILLAMVTGQGVALGNAYKLGKGIYDATSGGDPLRALGYSEWSLGNTSGGKQAPAEKLIFGEAGRKKNEGTKKSGSRKNKGSGKNKNK